jgi:hypothetical protein
MREVTVKVRLVWSKGIEHWNHRLEYLSLGGRFGGSIQRLKIGKFDAYSPFCSGDKGCFIDVFDTEDEARAAVEEAAIKALGGESE